MHVKSLKLIKEHSEALLDELYAAGITKNRLALGVKLNRAAEKSWTYELHIDVQVFNNDNEKAVFSTKLSYAAEFYEQPEEGEPEFEEFSPVWPFVRPDISSKLDKYGYANILPFDFYKSFVSNDGK